MTRLYDLLLAKPLPDAVLEFVLFVSFSLHLLFVLLTLGTAMIAVFFYVHSWWTGYRFELRWDKRVLELHLGLKSLAVVLGVAPLLLLQVLWSVPFFTAASILAPYWMALTGLMIVAFLSLDTLGHKVRVHPVAHMVVGGLGLAALLVVPAVFTAIMSLMEHPDKWSRVAQQGFRADPSLVAHWVLRYLHVLGAAALFGGAFHFFYSTKGTERRHVHMAHWMLNATLFQVVVGVLLLATVASRLSWPVTAAVAVGLAAAMALVGLALYRNPEAGRTRMRAALVLLPVVLVSMLLARQMLQRQTLGPFQARLEAGAKQVEKRIEPLGEAAFARFTSHLATVYDNGATIYANSCAFCHGATGNGNGPEAARLVVPPEKLSQVRAERGYLHSLLVSGTPGSAMPYFTIFDRNKLESLIDYLDARFGAASLPEAPDNPGSPEAAELVWKQTCATCHGQQGRGADYGRDLRPPVPDLTRYGLTPKRIQEVVAKGYDGTVMQPFDRLPETARQGLATLLVELRRNASKTP